MTTNKKAAQADTRTAPKIRPNQTNHSRNQIKRTLISDAAHADYLRRYVVDSKREFWFFADDIFLGTEPITSFDDATAAHHFLIWLHARREQQKRHWEAKARRAGFKMIGSEND